MTSSDSCTKGDHITFHGFEFKFDRPIHPMSRIAAQFEGKNSTKCLLCFEEVHDEDGIVLIKLVYELLKKEKKTLHSQRTRIPHWLDCIWTRYRPKDPMIRKRKELNNSLQERFVVCPQTKGVIVKITGDTFPIRRRSLSMLLYTFS